MYLRGKKDDFVPEWDCKEDHQIGFSKLARIAIQAAQGMEFLESKKCVHRDLASRNILIGQDFVMKV